MFILWSHNLHFINSNCSYNHSFNIFFFLDSNTTLDNFKNVQMVFRSFIEIKVYYNFVLELREQMLQSFLKSILLRYTLQKVVHFLSVCLMSLTNVEGHETTKTIKLFDISITLRSFFMPLF